jgi:SNF2 family DNA or RNA helicase
MGSPSKNLKELHERTKDLIIRRKNEDVKIERPKKTVTELYIELSDSDTNEYNKLLKQLFRKWTEDKKPTIGTMPTIQQFLISKKLERLYEIIDEYLESNRSVVVFSTYKAPLKEVYKKYKDVAGEITGDMNIKERQKTIDGLKDGKLKVGCITIGAGKMGIDGMQYGCDTVVFLDVDWVPSNMEQAESRIDRAGQTNPVSVYYLLCNDTIDIYMKELLDEKQKVVDAIVDGQVVTLTKERGMFKDFVKMLEIHKELIESKKILRKN